MFSLFIKTLTLFFMDAILKTKDISYQLRDNHTIYQPKFKGTTYGKYTFAYYGSHIWNALPNPVRESAEITCCKSRLKTWERANCNAICVKF